jgi:hypothetical protein
MVAHVSKEYSTLMFKLKMSYAEDKKESKSIPVTGLGGL